MAGKAIKRNEIIEDNWAENAIKQAGDLKKKLDETNETLKETVKLQAELIRNTEMSAKSLKVLEQAEKEQIKIEQDQQKLIISKLKLENQLEAAVQKKQNLELGNIRIQERQAKNATKRIKQLNDEKSAYTRLSKELNDLRKRYKDLDAAGRGTGKVARGLLNEITALDTRLKSIDARAGQFQRFVGQYERGFQQMKVGFSQLKNVIAQFGVALGGVQIAKNVFNTINTFGQSIANLSAITGATGKDLDFFKDKAIELGEKTTLSSSQVAEAFKLIGSAQPELLKNSAALAQVTEDAITLSEAAGIDLTDAAAALTNTLNQFGAGANQASKFVDVLAAGSKAGAGDINFLNAAFDKSGTVASAAGLTFVESASALEVLAKSGADASTSGTNFRNILINLQSAGIGFVDGQFDLVAALEQVNKNLDDIEDPAKRAAAATELFGKKNLAAGLFLKDNIDLYQELNVELDKNGVAQEQQRINTDTLQGSIDRLNSAWEGYILRLSESNGIGISLKDTFNFLAENLDTILNLVFRLVQGFILYKSVMFTLNLVTKAQNLQEKIRTKGLASLFIQQKAVNTATKEGTKSIKIFNKTLKAAPIGLIISGLTTVVGILGDLVGATDEATEAQRKLNEELEKGRQLAEGRASSLESVGIQLSQLENGTRELNAASIKGLLSQVRNLQNEYAGAAAELDDIIAKQGLSPFEAAEIDRAATATKRIAKLEKERDEALKKFLDDKIF